MGNHAIAGIGAPVALAGPRIAGLIAPASNALEKRTEELSTLRVLTGVRWLRSILATSAFAVVGGCGTYVPEHQEAYYTDPEKSREAAVLLENAIVHSVTCELHNAVIDVIAINPRHSSFAREWAVQVQLSLTINEKTSVAPGALMTFLPSLFTLLFGGSVSSEATRVDVFNFYYPIDTLVRPPKCDKDFPVEFQHPGGSLLVRSDLKTQEWLQAVLTNHVIAGSIDPADAKNGMQHHVTFVIETSGNITPGAKLARVTLMPSGNFLTVARKRTHDLLLTFGPASDQQKGQQILATNAQNMHQVGQFASALRGANVVVTTP